MRLSVSPHLPVSYFGAAQILPESIITHMHEPFHARIGSRNGCSVVVSWPDQTICIVWPTRLVPWLLHHLSPSPTLYLEWKIVNRSDEAATVSINFQMAVLPLLLIELRTSTRLFDNGIMTTRPARPHHFQKIM